MVDDGGRQQKKVKKDKDAHPLLEYAEELSTQLERTKRKLDGWIVDLDLWIRRGGEPSPFLTSMFSDVSETFDHQLASFRSLIDRRQGFATLEDVEEHIWERRKTQAAASAPKSLLVDIDIYLDTYDKEPILQASEALGELLGSIDASVLTQVEVWGSWGKRIAAKVKQAEALEKAAEALKAAMVNLPQAQANSENADAVSKLISSVEATPNAVLRFGPVLIVKVTMGGEAAIVTTDLNADQVRQLNRHPQWLLEPQQLLARLSDAENASGPELPQEPCAS